MQVGRNVPEVWSDVCPQLECQICQYLHCGQRDLEIGIFTQDGEEAQQLGQCWQQYILVLHSLQGTVQLVNCC